MEKFKMAFKQAIQKYENMAFDNLYFDEKYNNDGLIHSDLTDILALYANELNVIVVENNDYLTVSFNSDEVKEVLYLTEIEDNLGYKYRYTITGEQEYIEKDEYEEEF